MRQSDHPGVFTDGEALYTENFVPGQAVYGEALVERGGREFRLWNPRRSKLAALLLSGIPPFPLGGDSHVLYLGAATGTTVSHLSDIVTQGTIYAVEIAPKAFHKLLRLAEGRENVVPILGDARTPATYESLVGPVDLLYQDLAQREQAQIFVKNAASLRDTGTGVLMVKARSVDVAASPETVFRQAEGVLREGSLRVESVQRLEPYQKDHAAFLARRRGPARREGPLQRLNKGTP